MGIFVLWATWVPEHIGICVKICEHRTSGHFKRAGDM